MSEPFPPFQKHSETSRQAARDVSAKPMREIVLEALIDRGNRGATDDELQTALGMDPSTERPRRVELERAGLVIDSGERRKTRSGREAVVWMAV
jgi:transcription initiation factor IIE alpha subunit